MKKLIYLKKFEEIQIDNIEEKKFLKEFENFLPEKCPIKHEEFKTDEEILRIPKSDGEVYFYIGSILNDIDSSYYDNLTQEEQDELDEKLVDIVSKKYNMEW